MNPLVHPVVKDFQLLRGSREQALQSRTVHRHPFSRQDLRLTVDRQMIFDFIGNHARDKRPVELRFPARRIQKIARSRSRYNPPRRISRIGVFRPLDDLDEIPCLPPGIPFADLITDQLHSLAFRFGHIDHNLFPMQVGGHFIPAVFLARLALMRLDMFRFLRLRRQRRWCFKTGQQRRILGERHQFLGFRPEKLALEPLVLTAQFLVFRPQVIDDSKHGVQIVFRIFHAPNIARKSILKRPHSNFFQRKTLVIPLRFDSR